MELWIRSQNKEFLILAQHLDIYNGTLLDDEEESWYIEESGNDIGEYKTKERALEVLDEIQNLIKNQYIVECKPLVNKEDADKLKKHFIDNYSGEFILQPPTTEIHPINPNVVVYEMPEK